MNTSVLNYIIIYSKTDTDEERYFGFKLFNKDEASKYIKCIKKLSDEGLSFQIGDDHQEFYNDEDFIMTKISGSDIKFLNKLFELNLSGDQCGIFPDAISDAYEFGILDEYSDEDEDEDEEDDD